MTSKSASLKPDMRVREVAEALALHPETIRIMARQGKFRGAYKVGGANSSQIRIPWEAVEEYRKTQPPVAG